MDSESIHSTKSLAPESIDSIDQGHGAWELPRVTSIVTVTAHVHVHWPLSLRLFTSPQLLSLKPALR